jgi:hypothetical protein
MRETCSTKDNSCQAVEKLLGCGYSQAFEFGSGGRTSLNQILFNVHLRPEARIKQCE